MFFFAFAFALTVACVPFLHGQADHFCIHWTYMHDTEKSDLFTFYAFYKRTYMRGNVKRDNCVNRNIQAIWLGVHRI